MNMHRSLVVFAVLVLGSLPVPSLAETFRVSGQDLVAESRTTSDGTVTIVHTIEVNGSIHHLEMDDREAVHSKVTMTTVIQSDNTLVSANVEYTQLGRGGFSVTVAIDPCWRNLVNLPNFSADQFGSEVVGAIERQGAGTAQPCWKVLLQQRLSLLAAKTALGFVKA